MPHRRRIRLRTIVFVALGEQPKSVATRFDASAPDCYAQAERAGGFGDKPLVVLTRGRVPSVPATASDEERQFAAYEKVWMHEIQPKLARLSTRGRQVIVAGSGHMIPDEAPDAVVEAVRQVVSEARRGVTHGAEAIYR